MTHGNDVNQFTQSVERVHHAVVADADPPETLAALEFLASGRPRLDRERFNLRENSLNQLRREFLEFLASGSAQSDGVLSHEVSPHESNAVSQRPEIRAAHVRADAPAGNRKSLPTDPHTSSDQSRRRSSAPDHQQGIALRSCPHCRNCRSKCQTLRGKSNKVNGCHRSHLHMITANAIATNSEISFSY